MGNFFLWFLLCPEVLRCYFLNHDANDSSLTKTWSPGHWSDQLFGWSMSHFKEDLYVGAPLENQEDGALYKCSNLERSPTCEKVKKRPKRGFLNHISILEFSLESISLNPETWSLVW